MVTPLLHTCAACGAEEPLDALLARMINDDTTRRLVTDLLAHSLPVGSMVSRYLRLHKPAKQELRMTRVEALLAELVPDIKAASIQRAGRRWHAPVGLWREAFTVVFDAQAADKLRLPLKDNAYLYEVLMRLADRAEAKQERAEQQGHQAGASRVEAIRSGEAATAAQLLAPVKPMPPPPPAPAALPSKERLDALNAVKTSRAMRQLTPTQGIQDEH